MTESALGTPRADRHIRSFFSPVTLVLLAILVWGLPFLAPNSLFWDDWLLLAGNPQKIYSDIGFPWVGHVMSWLMLAGPWAVKVVALGSTIMTVLGVFAISARGLGLSVRERWVLSAVSVVVPLNVAHGSVGVLTLYTACVAAFIGAWWTLVGGSGTSRPSHRRAVLAAVLFFASFTTASLLVFLVVPAVHFSVLFRDRERSVGRGVLGLFARYWYLPSAPVLFWVLRSVFFTPTGAYSHYNKFHLPTSLTSPAGVGVALCGVTMVVVVLALAVLVKRRHMGSVVVERPTSMVGGVTATMWAAYVAWTMGDSSASGVLVVSTLVAVASALLIAGAMRRPPAAAVLALTGLALVSIAYVPYLLVEKLATFENWESRHQLLLPFGVSMLVVAGGRTLVGLCGRRPAIWVSGGLITAMAVLAASAPISLVLDWRKQEQLVEMLSEQSELGSARTVEFEDLASGWNWDGRRYRFYEFTALLGAAYGGQSRLGGDAEDIARALSGQLSPLTTDPEMYGVADWQDDGSVIRVTIVPREGADAWDLFFGRPSMVLVVEEAP